MYDMVKIIVNEGLAMHCVKAGNNRHEKLYFRVRALLSI